MEPKGRVPRAEVEHHEMLDAWLKRKDARVCKLIDAHLAGTLGDLRAALRPHAAPRPRKTAKKKAR